MANENPTVLDAFFQLQMRDNAPVGTPTPDMSPYDQPRVPALNVRGAATLEHDPVNNQNVLTVTGTAAPTFIAALNTLKPSATRQIVFVDGFSAVGDGGEGAFEWDAAYASTGDGYNGIGGTIVVPSYVGYTTGAWRRITERGRLNAAWYGIQPSPFGTAVDAYPALQHLLDLNNGNRGGPGVFVPETSVKQAAANDIPACVYFVSQPIVVNDLSTDTGHGTGGNTTNSFTGQDVQSVTLAALCSDGKAQNNTEVYAGPVVIAGHYGDNPPTYVADTYNGHALTALLSGSTVHTITAIPGNYLNLTELDLGDIEGLTRFTCEFLFNPLSTDTSGTFVLVSCGGGTPGAPAALAGSQTLRITRSGTVGNMTITALVRTNVKTYTVNSNLHDVTMNVMNHIALVLDTVAGTLDLYINMAQPDAAMHTTVGVGETIAMDPSNEFFVGHGGFAIYPSASGIPFWAGTSCRWGKIRISDSARYSTTGSPIDHTTWTCDSSTRLLVDWDATNQPASNSFAVGYKRSTLAGWIVARTGVTSRGRPRTNLPVWLNLHTAYYCFSYGLKMSGMTLRHTQGYAGVFHAQRNFDIDVRSNAQSGIDLVEYCFNGRVAPNAIGTGTVGYSGTGKNGNSHSWNYMLGLGAQTIEVGQAESAFCNTNYHGVHTSGDACVRPLLSDGNCLAGFLLCSESTGVCIEGFLDDDERGAHTYASIIAARCDSLSIKGGEIASAAAVAPIWVGSCNALTTNSTVISGAAPAIFAFDDTANADIAVEFGGRDQTNLKLFDPAHPGPVIVRGRDRSGKGIHVVTSADVTAGGILLTQDEYSYGEIHIIDPGRLLSGSFPVYNPWPGAGYRRTVVNETQQTLSFGSTNITAGATSVNLSMAYYPVAANLRHRFSADNMGVAVMNNTPATSWTDPIGGVTGTGFGSGNNPYWMAHGSPNRRMPAVLISPGFGTDCRFQGTGLFSTGTTRTVLSYVAHDPGGNQGGIMLATDGGATPPGAYFYHFSPGAVSPWAIAADGSANITVPTSNDYTTTGLTQGTPSSYAWRMTSGAQASLRLNGAALSISGGTLTPAFGGRFAIGGDIGGSFNVTASMMELSVHDAILTDFQIAQVELFYRAFWGVSA